MTDPSLEIAVRLGAAWAAGSLIGLERTLHGRPAGFRTFGLITVSSALLMVFTFSQAQLAGIPNAALPVDPRMAQGIMTGIGFIGAGVVFKEGLTVHGLTSAASVWAAAALGITIGAGFWWPALLALTIVLITLAVLKKLEDRLPRFHVTFVRLCFERQAAPRAEEVRELLRGSGFTLKEMSFRLDPIQQVMEYRLAIRTRKSEAVEQLAARFCQMPEVRGFEFSPTDE